MGRTANIIIKDVIHVFASISKIMRILLMGRRNREHCLKRIYRCKSLRFTLVLNPEMEVLNFKVTDILWPPYWSLSCPPTQGHSLRVQTTQI